MLPAIELAAQQYLIITKVYNMAKSSKKIVSKGSSKPLLPAVPSYKISKKKVVQLYSAVHEEIMQVRIAVDKLSNKELSDQIDNILGRLCFEAPQKAIDVFKA